MTTQANLPEWTGHTPYPPPPDFVPPPEHLTPEEFAAEYLLDPTPEMLEQEHEVQLPPFAADRGEWLDARVGTVPPPEPEDLTDRLLRGDVTFDEWVPGTVPPPEPEDFTDRLLRGDITFEEFAEQYMVQPMVNTRAAEQQAAELEANRRARHNLLDEHTRMGPVERAGRWIYPGGRRGGATARFNATAAIQQAMADHMDRIARQAAVDGLVIEDGTGFTPGDQVTIHGPDGNEIRTIEGITERTVIMGRAVREVPRGPGGMWDIGGARLHPHNPPVEGETRTAVRQAHTGRPEREVFVHGAWYRVVDPPGVGPRDALPIATADPIPPVVVRPLTLPSFQGGFKCHFSLPEDKS